MKTLDLDTVKKIWKFKLANNFDPNNEFFNLYVDNPFCFLPKCEFCIYHPYMIRNKEDARLKDEYYRIILINQIRDFGEVFSLRKPDAIYFGGGTSSLMTIEQMERVFNEFQQYFNFRKVEEKHFELNPLSTTDEKIDLLLKWNFTHFSFGFQTCNKQVLKFNNRINAPLERMKQITQKLEGAGAKYNIDLLTFIYKGDSDEEVKILKNDLEVLKKEIHPQRITIFPNYKRISYTKETAHRKSGIIEDILKMRLCVYDFLKDGAYVDITGLATPPKFTKEMLELNYPRNPQLIRRDKSQERWEIYNSSAPWNKTCSRNHSTLALGGWKDRKPYSYISDKLWYSTKIDESGRTFEIHHADINYS